MKHFIHVLLACALVLCAAPPPRANASPAQFAGDTIFEAVDGVEIPEDRAVILQGLVQGQREPSEIRFSTPSVQATEACTKFALLAQAKPGRYLLLVSGANTEFAKACRLVRR